MSLDAPVSSDRRPHLLYLAFFYPPSRSSGVYRAHATVKSFIRKGWDVTVLTTDEGFFDRATGSSDWSLVDEIPDEANVVRVPFDLPTAGPPVDLRTFSWLRGNFHWLWFRIAARLRRATKFVDVLRGEDQIAWDLGDRYVAWIDPVVKAALDATDGHPADAVLATGNPFASFEAARLIGRVRGVPFAIDYRDPWALDVRTAEPLERPRAVHEAERRIASEAAFAVFVNAATIDLYTDILPELDGKCVVVFNGYDETSRAPSVRPVEEPLRFGMIGTATNLWPLEEFFAGWRKERRALGDPTVVLGGYLGYFHWSASPLEEIFPSESEGFRYLGPVAKAEVGAFYDDIDVIVVLLFGGSIITAGKMYESMAQGKPILCVQPAGGGARTVFEEHPFAVCVDPDVDEIARGLHEVSELARSLSVERRTEVRRDMEKYERLAELDRLVDHLADAAGIES